jgi:hypothetical protein
MNNRCEVGRLDMGEPKCIHGKWKELVVIISLI